MEYSIRDGEICIPRSDDFSPERIFGCGQCFRWNRQSDGRWVGVAKDRVLSLTEREEGIFLRCSEEDFVRIWSDYFDLERDYAALRDRISTDPFTARAVEFGAGIRVLKQDAWEALCTFILSQCNNIARITGLVERLCDMFGTEIVFEGEKRRLFPAPERLAFLRPEELAPLRAGYRADYIRGAAREIVEGRLVPETLRHVPTADAIRALTGLKGVGVKVASCAALFGLGKGDAFPVDVWMKRAIERYYGGESFDSSVFGADAGIAQQYIFYYIRSLKGTTNEGCCY